MHVPTLRDWFSSSLLPPTLTIWFSLGHKRNESGIETLFSRDHKLYASDYDSVASAYVNSQGHPTAIFGKISVRKTI